MSDITVVQAKLQFLESISALRSNNTLEAYSNALDTFLKMLVDQRIDISKLPVSQLRENSVADFVNYTTQLSPSTESLYLQVIKSFFEFLDSEHLITITPSRIRMIIRKRTRRSISHQLYPEHDVKHLIEFMNNLEIASTSNRSEMENLQLRDLRDRALILTLADTGIRVEELCNLRCGDINWDEGRAIISRRGNKQAIVRFSTRALNALSDYQSLRIRLDQETGKPRNSLPLFARHDKGTGKKIQSITPTTIRNIVNERVFQSLGPELVGKITPHTFLHHFVTSILRATGNLKLAQVLARHSNIQVTQRYAHLSDDELNKGYFEVFEKKTKQPNDV